MKKIILSVAIIITISLFAKAQNETSVKKDFKLSIGPTAGIPVGDFKIISSFVIGGDLQGELALAPTFGVTLSAGYLNFLGKSGISSSGFIPILLGGKYYFTEKIYGHAQFGISLSTEKDGKTAFTYAPSIGYAVSEKFDIAAKYQSATKDGFSVSFIGIRIAHSF